jgi:hypothetical protein
VLIRSPIPTAKDMLPRTDVPALLNGLGVPVGILEVCVDPAVDVEFPNIEPDFPGSMGTFTRRLRQHPLADDLLNAREPDIRHLHVSCIVGMSSICEVCYQGPGWAAHVD